MTVSYKFILDKRRKSSTNVYPLKVRAYYREQSKERALEIYLNEKDWNEADQTIRKSAKDYKSSSFKLNNARMKLDRTLLLAESNNQCLTHEQLLQCLDKEGFKPKLVSIKDFWEEVKENMLRAGKAGTVMIYQDSIQSLLKFAGDKITFENVTYKLLEEYHSFMLYKGLKLNSAAAYLRGIRAIYNRAIKAGIVSRVSYPFNDFKIETEDTFNRTLSVAEMRSIILAPLVDNTPVWDSRNLFILSFCLVGMNLTDLLTLRESDISDGIVSYRRQKTGKLYRITLHPFVNKLLEHYHRQPSRNDHKYIFPAVYATEDSLLERKAIKQVVKSCNKYLKRIAAQQGLVQAERLSTYYARYTWANIARSLGYSKDFIAEALGHEYGNAVTGIYLDRYDSAKIDEANKHIIELVLPSNYQLFSSSFLDVKNS